MTATTFCMPQQRIEIFHVDYHGREGFVYETHDVRDITVQGPDHIEHGLYETTVEGLITWDSEHHIVRRTYWGVVSESMVRRDGDAWQFTGEVVGYEPGVS